MASLTPDGATRAAKSRADIHAILAKVQQGVEVVVEQDHRPVATLRTPFVQGRLILVSIALAEARGASAVPDEGFMQDMEEGIAERSQSWNPPIEAERQGLIIPNADVGSAPSYY